MSESTSVNTHQIIAELFRAMDTEVEDRPSAKIARWADPFPYVNGHLFSGSRDIPVFSKIARSYLLNIGKLDWKTINPDIFGSMIQAIADDDERGALGMHYTSVPNILKVLNPLFLDDLRENLEEAGENPRKLLNLRNRIAKIRVFDPACGSGNFLVIAYKQMREIEAEINRRRGEADRKSGISLRNFRGIEIRDFPCEIARLALIIAEFQCDERYLGEQLARAEFLPLDQQNWIVRGNALRLDWLSICPPTGKTVKHTADDLFHTPLDQPEIEFENEGGETYICGNPPYLGSKWQSPEQKGDLRHVFGDKTKSWKSLDYVAGWFAKAAQYGTKTRAATAFVATNSICQGLQVPLLWPYISSTGHEISFAHTSFKWSNLASKNAGVMVSIVSISNASGIRRKLFSLSDDGSIEERRVDKINAYLAAADDTVVEQRRTPLSELSPMLFGNMPRDGGNFVLSGEDRTAAIEEYREIASFVRPYLGSEQMIQGKPRWCIWIEEEKREYAQSHPLLSRVLSKVRDFRQESAAISTQEFAERPHRFVQIAGTAQKYSIAVAKVSSERRPYLPVDLIDGRSIISDLLFAMYDAPLWNFSIAASNLHIVWIATVCGKLKTDYRYSNTLGWNTFPVPTLTEKHKSDLTRCAEDILLARESYFPATIADMYDPKRMDSEFPEVRAAHDRNDETLERIYIGRCFKNDTERLEKLFDMHTKMTAPKTRAS